MPDPQTTPDWATKAAEAVIDDLTCRRGLRHEFDNIDPDIQEEIKATWAGLIWEAVNGKL